MKVINPTDKQLTVTIAGTEYTVEPKDVLKNVPEEAAVYWKDKLHNFLLLEEDTVVKEEPVKVEKEEVKKEEAPKKEVETKKTK